MVAVPVRRAEKRPFAELGEVGGQRRMEVGTAEQFDPGPLGEQPAETPSLVGIGDARQVKSSLLVKQPLARLYMPLDPIDDPEQAGRGPAREERLAGKILTRTASQRQRPLSPGKTTVRATTRSAARMIQG